MKTEETQVEYLKRHAIPTAELPPRISRGWRFAGEKSVSTPEEAVEPVLETESGQVNLPPADYLDYYDPEEDLELQELLDGDDGWYWFQFLEEIATRLENAYMANEARIDWLKAREKLRKLFVGTHKDEIRVRRKRQDFNEVEGNHGWYGGKTARDRDNRHQSMIEDWGDDPYAVDDHIEQTEYCDPYYDSSDEDFDWRKFNAGGQDEAIDAQRLVAPVELRDTTQFQKVARFMRSNAPKYTPPVRNVIK